MGQDPSDKTTAKPVSKSKRFFKLAGMTASVAGNYAKSKLKSVFKNAEESARQQAESYQESGERIAKTLGELKGAAMKIGQMASVASDVLPKELSSALKSLQNEAPPMSFDVIASQIEQEFGARPEILFNHFDPEPFAAASIGQVHRAQVDDGREVVVKVQYPGVDSSVDSDLAHLKLALRASGLVKMNRKAFNS
ncbi:MAG: AarF/UbiB family protein, partial [Myxococcota bacterium]